MVSVSTARIRRRVLGFCTSALPAATGQPPQRVTARTAADWTLSHANHHELLHGLVTGVPVKTHHASDLHVGHGPATHVIRHRANADRVMLGKIRFGKPAAWRCIFGHVVAWLMFASPIAGLSQHLSPDAHRERRHLIIENRGEILTKIGSIAFLISENLHSERR